MNVSNHSCDELVLYRSKAVSLLPSQTVNDGAFMAGVARLKGYSIKVSADALVHIRTPKRITDVISQRRRILFGHAQVWRRVGTPPKTIESLLFLSPVEGVRLLVKTLAARPKFLEALPLAVVSELSATLLSIFDTISMSRAHAVWRRFE
jgi:cellulose synthase/poly-beta-1,6-N-acetylglucosamine synthase-like glycosyltransferase